MTERLNDDRLHAIAENNACSKLSRRMARELLGLRIAVRELRNNLGILEVVLADKDAKLAEQRDVE